MELNLRPLADRVVIKREKAEDKTPGGIVLPDAAKEKPKKGVVCAVGAGKFNEAGKRIPVGIKKGDRVIFASYAGTEVKIEGEEHLIMAADDILAVIG